MEKRLEAQISIENTRRSRKQEANKTLQKDKILYSINARRINKERLEIELIREKEREVV